MFRIPVQAYRERNDLFLSVIVSFLSATALYHARPHLRLLTSWHVSGCFNRPNYMSFFLVCYGFHSNKQIGCAVTWLEMSTAFCTNIACHLSLQLLQNQVSQSPAFYHKICRACVLDTS